MLSVISLTAGCSSSGDDSVSVRRALSSEGTQSVSGFLVVEAGTTYLCDEIAESFPPQCGEYLIEIVGLDLATVADVQSFEDTSWTDQQITVKGNVRSGVFTVD
ncbi:MAG: hypothetical protein ACRBK7_31000 [Acidimicrobiales bacterium]